MLYKCARNLSGLTFASQPHKYIILMCSKTRANPTQNAVQKVRRKNIQFFSRLDFDLEGRLLKIWGKRPREK